MKKKVIKRACTYSLMLMRDDGAVRCFTLKRGTLQFLKVLIFLFILLGASGIAIGYHYFDIIQDYASNKEELATMRAQLTQLNNYEKLAEVAAPLTPIAKNEQIAVAEPTPPEQSFLALNSTKEVNVASEQTKTNATKENSSEKTSNNATKLSQTSEPTFQSIESDESPLRVNNFNGRKGSSSDLRIRYELVSSPQDQMVRGTVSYFVKANDGKIFKLTVRSAEDMYFSLYRMKIFDFSISLPQGLSQNNVQSIILTLNIDNGKSFSQTFSLS